MSRNDTPGTKRCSSQIWWWWARERGRYVDGYVRDENEDEARQAFVSDVF